MEVNEGEGKYTLFGLHSQREKVNILYTYN